MKSEEPKRFVRCAIYARKSSEEGLEQSFNSLEAQREACEAFVTSHKHEGWRVLATRYDDGGYSGGTLDRPSLKRLLDDIEAGQVDAIVVYKVDRLTRSLSDFAKIIEVLERRSASFISVTQHFNTTTSMGRLSLNVLLSFAQFEREVTGERIRDKVAASKRKGMWMGGHVPLGYELKDHKLVIQLQDAEFVRSLYQQYLNARRIPQLKNALDSGGIKTKIRVSRTGKQWGGRPYSRGELYRILSNPVYVGEVRHKDSSYSGEHAAIVPRELWDGVQVQLMAGNHKARNTRTTQEYSSLLGGLLQDDKGHLFTHSYTLKGARKYRYYVCENVMSENGSAQQRKATRWPAQKLEEQIMERLHSLLASGSEVFDGLGVPDDPASLSHRLLFAARDLSDGWSSLPRVERQQLVRDVVTRAVIHPDRIEVSINQGALRQKLIGGFQAHAGENESDSVFTLLLPNRHSQHRGNGSLVFCPGSTDRVPIPSLVKAIARAYDWCERLKSGEVENVTSLARKTRMNPRYVRRLLDWAFLAPDIIESILSGEQPANLKLETFRRGVPLSWEAQRSMLGLRMRPSAATA